MVLIKLFEGLYYLTFKKRDQTLPHLPSNNLKILKGVGFAKDQRDLLM